MPKNKISEYSQTPEGNEDVGSIGITGEAPVSNIDDAFQTIMAHLADMNAGAAPIDDTFTLASTISGQGSVRFDASQVGNSTVQVLTVPNASGRLVVCDEDGSLLSFKDNEGGDVDINARLLEGETASHYLNAGNLTGTISEGRFPAIIPSDVTGNAATATNATDHIALIGNPHGLTKADIGLDDVENIPDLNKVISNAVQAALDEKLSLNGGMLSGDIDLNGNNIIGLDALPSGLVAHFAMITAPTGWLKADGAAVSRTVYADLFAAIGDTFGAGDNSTTFNLPNLRGEFIRGFDDGLGIDAGRTFGSAQDDDNKEHNHYLFSSRSTIFGGGDVNGNYQDVKTEQDNAVIVDGNVSSSINNYYLEQITTNAEPHLSKSESVGSEARPRNIALLACIKT